MKGVLASKGLQPCAKYCSSSFASLTSKESEPRVGPPLPSIQYRKPLKLRRYFSSDIKMRCGRAVQVILFAAVAIIGISSFSKLTQKALYSPISEWILKITRLNRHTSTSTIRRIMMDSERLWAQTVAGRKKIMETVGDVGLYASKKNVDEQIAVLTDR